MQPRRGYIDGPFGQVHYARLGEGPALILNHQSGSSLEAFAAVHGRIAGAGFTTLALDSPGMGGSDAPDGDVWTLDMFARAGASVVTGLGLGRVIVGGHHTGAGTALRHACLFPEQVRGLVLHQLLLPDAALRAHFAANPIAPIVAQADGSHLLQAWGARNAAGGAWNHLEAMNRGVLDLLRTSPRVARSFAAALAYDPVPDIAAIAVPVLNLSNTGDHNHAFAQALRALRPDFDYAQLEGGAIDIMDEQPEAWADAVIAFARSLPA